MGLIKVSICRPNKPTAEDIRVVLESFLAWLATAHISHDKEGDVADVHAYPIVKAEHGDE
jgi:hypothetical protein